MLVVQDRENLQRQNFVANLKMKTEIQLRFNRKDFEEIYFRDHQGDYIRSPTTKTAFITLIITGVAFLSIFAYSFNDDSIALTFFFGFIFSFAIFNYVKDFVTLYKWKSQIFDYLDREEKYQNCKILLTENSFTLFQDDKETIEKWTNFTKVHSTVEFISLEGKENFLIPQKSMTTSDFQKLKDIISEKVR